MNQSLPTAQEAASFRLRPMGIGDILDETFRLYRKHFKLFIATVAPIQIVISLISYFTTSNLRQSLNYHPAIVDQTTSRILQPATVDFGSALANTSKALLGSVISTVGSLIILGLLAYVVSNLVVGRSVTVSDAYKIIMSKLGPLLISVLWAGLRIILMSMTIIGIPFAIYFGVSWVFMTQTIVVEGTNGAAASGRSRYLIQGFWWKTVGLFILIEIIVLIVLGIPSAIIDGAAGLFTTFDTINPIVLLVALVGNLLTIPAISIATTLLFFDLKVRKEAFDLEALASITTSAGSSAPTYPV